MFSYHCFIYLVRFINVTRKRWTKLHFLPNIAKNVKSK